METTRVVTETKVERVEVPKIVEHERVVTVDKPVVIERPTTAPRQTVTERFAESEEYRTAEFHGRIVKFDQGVIEFDNGRTLTMARPDGTPDHSITTTRYNGDLAYCRHDGSLGNGRERWPCKVLHHGVVEDIQWPPPND